MELGKRIIELRKTKGMTQEDIAELFGVTRQTISNWENGKSYPDITLLIKISEEFNVSIDELMKEDKSIINTIVAEEKIKKVYKFITYMFVLLLICTSIGVVINEFILKKNIEDSAIIEKVNYNYIEATESVVCNNEPTLYYEDGFRKMYFTCIDNINIVVDDNTLELKDFLMSNNLTSDWFTKLFLEQSSYNSRNFIYYDNKIRFGYGLKYKLSKDDIKIIECNSQSNNNIYITSKDIEYNPSLCE